MSGEDSGMFRWWEKKRKTDEDEWEDQVQGMVQEGEYQLI